jgi:hypothetical protein
MGFELINILIALLLLHFRNKSWCPENFRKKLTIGLVLIGIFGLIFHTIILKNYEIYYTLFFLSFIYYISDRKLRMYSIRKQNRDFYLESGIDYWVNNWNSDRIYKTTDIDTLISIGIYGLIGVLFGTLTMVQKLFWFVLSY